MTNLLTYILILLFSFTSSVNACYLPHATIGSGNIEIANGSGEGINRDVNKADEITKDITTGALNGSFTIDDEWLSGEGREKILKDFKNLSKNITTLTNVSIDAVVSLFDSMSNDEINNVVSTTKKGILSKFSKSIEDDKLVIDLSDIEDFPQTKEEAMEYLEEHQDINFEDLSSEEQKIISAIYLTYPLSDEIKKEKVKFVLSSIDAILQNDEIMKNLANYDNLSVSDKKETIESLSKILNDYSDDKKLTIKFVDDLDDSTYVEFNYDDDGVGKIEYNSKYLSNLGEMINTAYHEIGGHKLAEDYVYASSDLSDDYKYIDHNMGLYVPSEAKLKDNDVSLFPVYEKQPTESISFFTGNIGEDVLMSKIKEGKPNGNIFNKISNYFKSLFN